MLRSEGWLYRSAAVVCCAKLAVARNTTARPVKRSATMPRCGSAEKRHRQRLRRLMQQCRLPARSRAPDGVAVMKWLTLGVSMAARSHGLSERWPPLSMAGASGGLTTTLVLEAAGITVASAGMCGRLVPIGRARAAARLGVSGGVGERGSAVEPVGAGSARLRQRAGLRRQRGGNDRAAYSRRRITTLSGSDAVVIVCPAGRGCGVTAATATGFGRAVGSGTMRWVATRLGFGLRLATATGCTRLPGRLAPCARAHRLFLPCRKPRKQAALGACCSASAPGWR